MGGKWHFDSDSGAEEVIFRRIGQNEMQVIDICRRLESDADLEAGDNGPNREPAVAYALRLIEAGTKGPSAEASSGRPPTAPLHGYYFRQMEPGKPTADSLIVAYPAEYRSSGVMTFIVNQRGDVFQKDLGPQTVTLVGAMNTWRSDRTWKIVN
jgi:hypothetical protein